MQRSREWKIQNQETNTSTKLSNNLTFSHIFPLQNQFLLQEFLLANNPSAFFFIAQCVCEDFKTIHLRMKEWHGSLF